MIGIINYGSGNIQALLNIYGRLNIPVMLASKPADLETVDRVILPGVGAFDQTMHELNRSGVRDALERKVLGEGAPLLGICVGMQLLANSSEEGVQRGLGWIDGVVRRFSHSSEQRLQLPHMGWNTVEPGQSDVLFDNFEHSSGYYFLHSYYFSCRDAADCIATTDYGLKFASAVKRRNICGVQFHPEKSHQNGVNLLKNFALH